MTEKLETILTSLLLKINWIVAFEKDERLFKIPICLLVWGVSIGIYQNMIERQTPRENFDSKIAKHMAKVIHNWEPNPQSNF